MRKVGSWLTMEANSKSWAKFQGLSHLDDFLLADFFVAVSHLSVFWLSGYSILVLSSDQIKSSLTIPQMGLSENSVPHLPNG